LEHSPGCVLLKGKDSLCYSTDQKPLIFENNSYGCPLKTKVVLPDKIYKNLAEIVNYFFTIQDKEGITINVWPMLTGIANSKNKAVTEEGKEMVKLARNLREYLDKIIFDMD
jgi:hypothetical protein